MDYGLWGEHQGGNTSEHSFTGKKRDSATGLSYFGARYYDPNIGRFISMDPIKDGRNWYVYCNNNPLKYTDLTGLSPFIFFQTLTWPSCPPISIPFPQAGSLNIPMFATPTNLIDNMATPMGQTSSDGIDWTNPPTDPSQLGPDWEDKTDPRKAKNTNDRNYVNKKTGDEIEWHPAKKGETGYGGKNHWHRINPNKTGKKDYYLDKNGKPIHKNNYGSHIPAPKKLPTWLKNLLDKLESKEPKTEDNKTTYPVS